MLPPRSEHERLTLHHPVRWSLKLPPGEFVVRCSLEVIDLAELFGFTYSRPVQLFYFPTRDMLAVYYGYIALIAFDKPFLAKPVGTGVMSVGVPVGMAVIVFTIVITGIYVRRANSEYDQLTQDILKDVAK